MQVEKKLAAFWVEYRPDLENWVLVGPDGQIYLQRSLQKYAARDSVIRCKELIAQGRFAGIELHFRTKKGKIADRRTYPRKLDPSNSKG